MSYARGVMDPLQPTWDSTDAAEPIQPCAPHYAPLEPVEDHRNEKPKGSWEPQ